MAAVKTKTGSLSIFLRIALCDWIFSRVWRGMGWSGVGWGGELRLFFVCVYSFLCCPFPFLFR